jgi:hypothetical protein
MAQEVAEFVPEAVTLRPEGYLAVDYAQLGLRLQTWDEWAPNGLMPPLRRLGDDLPESSLVLYNRATIEDLAQFRRQLIRPIGLADLPDSGVEPALED